MIYDIAIIGAGPAGLMAGIRAAELGAKVILLEKNKRPGLKLLTTGGGRCNLTNAIYNPKELAEKYGVNGKFLISAFNKFGAKELVDFFNDRGLFTKIEKINQVFPESNRSTEVLNMLINEFKKNGGKLMAESTVRNIVAVDNKITKIVLNSNEEKIGNSLDNFEELTANFSKLADSLNNSGLNRTLASLESAVSNLDNLMTRMNSGDGTLGKLLNDEKLYTNLNNASRELDLLLQDLRLNPKRYVNVSVFGKKQKEYELPEDDPAMGPTEPVGDEQ